MTQHYFLAAKTPLKFGSFGSKPEKISNGRIYYDSEVDASGIYVEKLADKYAPKHLKLPYKALVSVDFFGSFDYTDNPKPTDIKCLTVLYEYIQDILMHSFSLEWYSAWDGEENWDISNRRDLILKELTSPLQLMLHDREYVKVLRHNNW